jgi:hypothetical protein
MEDVGIFYGCLVYLTAIWYFCGHFVIFYGHLVYFSCFGVLYQEKSGSPAPMISSRVDKEAFKLEESEFSATYVCPSQNKIFSNIFFHFFYSFESTRVLFAMTF